MANIPGLITSEVANVDLTRGVAVIYGTGGVILSLINSPALAGVVIDDVLTWKVARVQNNGLASVKLGGTVTVGMPLTVTAAGLFVDASTNPVVATARKAGVSGEIIEAMLV